MNISFYAKHPAAMWGPAFIRIGRRLPDRLYLKVLFFLETGKRLNLISPKSFCEKLQWLKLYDRRSEYITMVDKLSVKDYVANIIGEEYIIPTLGVWSSPEDIEFDKLPDKFVLKTTHGGGNTGVIICKDKLSFDKDRAIKKLKKSLKQNIYSALREWPYKNVPRRIIAEQYIDPEPNAKDLSDYKWFCFNGEPRYCQVIQNRSTEETIDFYDTNWEHQEFVGLNPLVGLAARPAARPAALDIQLRIARELSKNIPFVRIDLYETGEKTYFGEITFYPKSGLGIFTPRKYDDILGKMIELPDERLNQ